MKKVNKRREEKRRDEMRREEKRREKKGREEKKNEQKNGMRNTNNLYKLLINICHKNNLPSTKYDSLPSRLLILQ